MQHSKRHVGSTHWYQSSPLLSFSGPQGLSTWLAQKQCSKSSNYYYHIFFFPAEKFTILTLTFFSRFMQDSAPPVTRQVGHYPNNQHGVNSPAWHFIMWSACAGINIISSLVLWPHFTIILLKSKITCRMLSGILLLGISSPGSIQNNKCGSYFILALLWRKSSPLLEIYKDWAFCDPFCAKWNLKPNVQITKKVSFRK